MRKIYAAAVALGLIGASSPASAAITICLGAGCNAQPASQVLAIKNATGLTVNGTLNNAPGMVLVSSTEQLINTANGQANFQAVDGVLDNPISIALDSGVISALELNLDALTDGFVTFSFQGGNSNGTSLGPFGLDDRGANWFNGYDGTFSSVTMSFSGGATIADLHQIRLTRASAAPAVPEPATWLMMILGFAAIGTAARRRRRRGAAALA